MGQLIWWRLPEVAPPPLAIPAVVEVKDLSLEEHSRFRTSLDLYGKRYSKYQLAKKAVSALRKEAVAAIDSKYSSYIKSAVTLRDIV